MFCRSWSAGLVAGVMGVVGLAPAAPIPKHLMPKDSSFVFPSQVGTKWVFDLSGQTDTWVITNVEEKDGGKLITTECEPPNGKRTPHQKIWVGQTGLFLAQEGGEDYDKPWCICKLPHKDGQTWDTTISRKALQMTGSMRSAAMEEIEVPAGKFLCTRVEWTMGQMPGRPPVVYWYASGVGLVRMGNPPTRVLKKFTPGN